MMMMMMNQSQRRTTEAGRNLKIPAICAKISTSDYCMQVKNSDRLTINGRSKQNVERSWSKHPDKNKIIQGTYSTKSNIRLQNMDTYRFSREEATNF